MIVTSHQPKNFLGSLSVTALGLVLTACAGGSYTSTPSGEQVAAQATAQQVQANELKQPESVNAPPKRGPQDPIYVNLAAPVLDSKMQRIEKRKGAVAQRIRKEFVSDPIIQLVPGRTSAEQQGQSSPVSSIADVDVASKVSLKETDGLNRKTGKPGKVAAVVFEATITSQTPPATYTVSETGHVSENVEVSKRFAKQVRQVIIERIGPEIPAH